MASSFILYILISISCMNHHLQPCWMHMPHLETSSLQIVYRYSNFCSHVLLHLERLPLQFVETTLCAYSFLFAVVHVSSAGDISGSSYLQQAAYVFQSILHITSFDFAETTTELPSIFSAHSSSDSESNNILFPYRSRRNCLKSEGHFHGGYRILDTAPLEIIVVIANNDRCRI